MWSDRVQSVYSSKEELISYDSMYKIAERVGYDSPEQLWEDNPILKGSTNPADLSIERN